jgi:uncharacterized protein YecE (DUF72 family)
VFAAPAARGRIRVGTSGWQYADWRDRLYPKGLAQRNWLAAYTEVYDTVEVNGTFYRLPTSDTVQRWADTVPADFVMAVKISRYLTHVKRLRDPAEPVERLLSCVAPLVDAGKLGPLLLQLPPDMRVDAGLLADTLARFPAWAAVAVEPRHRSWFVPAVRSVLEASGAALVWADRHGRATGPLWQTSDWAYLRLHMGRSGWQYDRRDLTRWATRMRRVGAGYVFANNDPGGAALVDATLIREMIIAG